MLISPSRAPNELDDSGEVCREYTLCNEKERKREGVTAIYPREKGLENPFGLRVGRGSIPRRALSLVFKIGGTTVAVRSTMNTRRGENSASGCKINEFDRPCVGGKAGIRGEGGGDASFNERSRVTAVVHTGSRS